MSRSAGSGRDKPSTRLRLLSGSRGGRQSQWLVASAEIEVYLDKSTKVSIRHVFHIADIKWFYSPLSHLRSILVSAEVEIKGRLVSACIFVVTLHTYITYHMI